MVRTAQMERGVGISVGREIPRKSIDVVVIPGPLPDPDGRTALEILEERRRDYPGDAEVAYEPGEVAIRLERDVGLVPIL